MFILAILTVFVGGALVLYAICAGAMEAKGVFSVVSRESALILNNVLLAGAALVVFVGTVWPLLAELFLDQKISVGPPYFNAAFGPFMVLVALAAPIGALLPWKRAKLSKAFRNLLPAALFAFAVLALIWAMQSGRSALGPLGMALGVWLIGGAGMDLWQRLGARALGR